MATANWFYPRNILFDAIPNQPTIYNACYDGTYGWVYAPNAGFKLFRFRVTDGVIVNSAGADSTYSDPLSYSTIALGYATSGPVTDGTYILQSILGFVYRFRAFDMSYVDRVATSTNSSGYNSVFDGTNFWFPCTSANTIHRIDSATFVRTGLNVTPQPYKVAFDGTSIWACSIQVGDFNVYRLNATTGATQLTLPIGDACYAICFDGTYIWAAGTGYVVKIRASDGAFINTAGAVVATYDLAKFPVYGTPLLANEVVTSISYTDTNLYIGHNGPDQRGTITRMQTSNGALGGRFTGFGNGLQDITIADTYLIVPAFNGTGNPGNPQVSIAEFDVTPPNLTEIAPNATGLLAVFSQPVTVTAPPILDPPYNGLIATGATTPLTDRIQFALTVPIAGATATTLLLSAIAYNLRIDLTFNKNVALTTIGYMPSSYVITTTTPGAVIPTVTSISLLNAVVTIHTTEQTTGAVYTVTISPGSIIATG